DLERATQLSAESASRFRDLNNSWGTALALTNLGRSALEQHDHARAAVLLGECLTLAQGLGEKVFIAECLGGLGALAAAQGKPERAACLWGAAEALREGIDTALSPAERAHHERHASAARAQTDEDAFSRAWAQGRTLSVDQAVEYALDDVQDP
ncbi:MAG: hypothetical protein M3281_07800, partial [Chloroflexota bacterium]|nr:hypothetical protein [Chloroflexota bacterium]